MDTQRVFISQPMHGRSLGRIFDERAAAIDEVTDLLNRKGIYDIVFLDNINRMDENVKVEISNCRVGRVAMLAGSIAILSTADYIYFAKGWNKANGCLVEYEITKNYFPNRYWTYEDYYWKQHQLNVRGTNKDYNSNTNSNEGGTENVGKIEGVQGEARRGPVDGREVSSQYGLCVCSLLYWGKDR